ncbi:MAG: hypothetical protein AAGE52_18670 [Myxococcota bacterium]
MRIGVALAIALVTSKASAWRDPTYDVASLIWRADAVVEAERLSVRGSATRFRVVERFVGQTPEVLEVPTGFYTSEPFYAEPRPGTRTWLFLRHVDGEWRLVASGLRVVVEDRVYRPQIGDWLGLMPQAADPEGTDRIAPALSPGAFRSLVARRVSEVNALREALRTRDRNALVAALGPVRRDREYYDDALGQGLIEALLAQGDVPGVLEVIARRAGTRFGRLPSIGTLLQHAEGASPVHQRVAALRGIERGMPRCSTVELGRLIALVAAEEPALRVAALRALVRHRDDVLSARMNDALQDLLARLQPDEVQVAAVRAARAWDLRPTGLPASALFTERSGDTIRVEWSRRNEEGRPLMILTRNGVGVCARDVQRSYGAASHYDVSGVYVSTCAFPYAVEFWDNGRLLRRLSVRGPTR